MIEVILTVGLNDKDTGKQEVSYQDGMATVIEVVSEVVEGFTISDATGGYTHKDGRFVQERSIRAELSRVKNKQVKTITSKLCKRLNQESVMVSRRLSLVQFASA